MKRFTTLKSSISVLLAVFMILAAMSIITLSASASTVSNVDPAKYTYDDGNGNLGNLKAALADGDIRISYIGGSITVGQGGTTNGKWTSRVSRHFRDAGYTVTDKHVGLGGTGTRLGAFRVADDVIAHNPELVFIEFAINDTYCKETLPNGSFNGLYMEYMLRSIREELPNTEIIVLLTTDKTRAKAGYSSMYNIAKGHYELANYYNAVTIDVGRYLLETIYPSGTYDDDIWNNYISDTVHPNDNGYAVYAEAICSYLNIEDITGTSVAAAAYTVPEIVKFSGADTFDARLIPITLDGSTINPIFRNVKGFTLGKPDTSPTFTYSLSANTIAASHTVDFRFVGTELSIYMNTPNEGVHIKVTLDGETKTDSKDNVRVTNGPKVFFENLENKVHEVHIEFTVDSGKTFTTGGNIMGILIGGVKNDGTGDADGDGELTPADATILARAIAGWTGTDYEGVAENTEFMDFNDDNKVNSVDLITLKRHLANWRGYEMLLPIT